ncbi:glycine N-acyltransferase-like [Haliotis cracherodii]|uniref:glycine N-acyltransferase-like n=1 Tax=Haliotis cracherodii TaxID=6455 RepID=UPI0039EADF86
MVIVLDNLQLPKLFATLERSRSWIRGEIISKLHSLITDYDFIVDRWPDYRALVVRVNPATAKFPVHLSMCTSVYASDQGILENLLQQPGVIDWSSRIGFIFDKILCQHQKTFEAEALIGMKITRRTLRLRPTPDGFKITSLTPEQANLVNSFWPNNEGIHSELYIKELISKLPSCCLYNSEESMVGYALTYPTGYIGFLRVLEEHRGKGYAKVIMSHLASFCLQQIEEVHIKVRKTNNASFALHQSIGFETEDEDTGWWLQEHNSLNTPSM